MTEAILSYAMYWFAGAAFALAIFLVFIFVYCIWQGMNKRMSYTLGWLFLIWLGFPLAGWILATIGWVPLP